MADKYNNKTIVAEETARDEKTEQLFMKRACLYQTSKWMKVLSSENRVEVHFDSAESRKTSVPKEQKFGHAALHMALIKK